MTQTLTATRSRPWTVPVVTAVIAITMVGWGLLGVAFVVRGLVALVSGFADGGGQIVTGIIIWALLWVLAYGLATFTRFQFRQVRGLLALDPSAYGNTIGLLKLFAVLATLDLGIALLRGGAQVVVAAITLAVFVGMIPVLRSARLAFGGGGGAAGNLDYVRGKVVQLVAVVLIVTFLSFLLLNLLPGGPETAARAGAADQEALDEFREEYRLDDPIPLQYGRWLGNAVDGDLGESYVHNNDVLETLENRLPVSLKLMAYAMAMALLVAIPMGILAAYKENTVFDKVSTTVAFGFLSIPNFIIAVLLVYLFALDTGWLSSITGGLVDIQTDWFPATVPQDEENLRTLFLPALSLALGQIAVFMRLLRTDMIATLQEDYIGVAKAKGMPTSRILFRHAFRPSSFSLLTVAGITIGNLIGGTVVVEQIFAINGLGRTIVVAIFERDYLVIQGAVVVIAVGFVVVNFLVDLLYAVLDPRIRHARAIA